jgi:hypothetical protein
MLLNPDKSEALLVARKSNMENFAGGAGIRIAGSDIAYSVQLKSLGVTLDTKLSLDQHIGNIVKSSNYNIRSLRHIRPMLSQTVANTIACSIVSTRLDYCNSLLYGTSVKNIQRLQRVQNTLARVVTGTKRRDHIKPVLRDLHWLPVAQRIEYKIALITHKVLSTAEPPYLNSLINIYKPSRQLRSEGKRQLVKPRGLVSSFGQRTFTQASATTWNNLPEDLRSLDSIKHFKAKLTTFLFSVTEQPCM